MSRPYFKNDLFNFALKRENDKARQSAMQALDKKNKQSKEQKQRQLQQQESQVESQERPFDITKALRVQIKQTPGKIDIDDELKDMFKTMKSKKKNQTEGDSENNQKVKAVASGRKSLFFTPKNTIKIQVPKTAADDKKEIPVQEQAKQQKKQRWENWKMGQELRKNFKFQKNEQKKKNGEEKQSLNPNQGQHGAKNMKNKKQKDRQAAKQGQSSDSSENEEEGGKQKNEEDKKAKTTGRKKKQKKITKQANYVKTDLKRKYRDRFVGALGRNIRNLGKKNMYKERMKRIENELQMDEGQIYNSYVVSLSKAMFMTISLDAEEQVLDNSLNYEIPKEYDRASLQKLIKDLFGFENFREGQYQTIRNILNGISTLFVSETASGKSLTYLLSSVILKGLTIVISPLVSLMLDQLQHLPNDLPAACISSLLNREQRDRILQMVKSGKIQLLFVTPESFLTDFMYHVRQFPPINFVCIDQAHSMSELSHSFRASYLSLEEIILKYFKYKNGKPVVLCLTATANAQTMESISQKLKIEENICSKTVINKNLFVTISREELSSKYQSLLRYLREDTIENCNGILVYCRTKKIMFEVFNYLRNSGLGCKIYHSGLPQKQKVDVMEQFRKGKLRIVIATVALGMGLDFQNLECVIHINMPKSVENYIQEIGRAGRRNKRAYCHLFLDKYDYFTERNYFLADQLEPESYKNIVETLKKNTERVLQKGKAEKPSADKKQQINVEDERSLLKRLTLEEQEGKQKEKQKVEEEEEFDENNIYYSDEEVDNNEEQSQDMKSERIDKNENNPAEKKQRKPLTAEQAQFLEIIEKQQKQIEEERFRPLSYAKAQILTEQTNLKQQALVNILLKIEKTLSRKVFKVLPLSYETIKVSFFKNNQNEIKQASPFFKKLVTNCKVMKGIIYVPMIRKCNELKMTPIQLLTELHGIGNKYWIKIEMINEIFIWQHRKSPKQTFSQLQNPFISDKIMNEFNIIQKTSLTKFNIFYSLCFNRSQKYLMNIIERGGIIPENVELREGGILTDFDHYFKQETVELYKNITDEGYGESQAQEGNRNIMRESPVKQQVEQNTEKEPSTHRLMKKYQQLLQKHEKFSAYLPISEIDEECLTEIQRSVELFIRHILSNNQDKPFVQKIKPYRNGRTMARVFLGVNDTNSNWKVYGEHEYWMKFKDKDYKQLLQVVKKFVYEFIINEGPKYLEIEEKPKKVTTKKE